MSVEAAPRALIWRNDTNSSKKSRKVSHLQNVSTIYSVRKSKRLSEKRDDQYQQHLQPRQCSRHHRHSRAGYNNQPTQRRRDAAGKRSTTGTVKVNRDQDSKTNTNQHLTSTHAEQSLRASDLPLELRNGIAIALLTYEELTELPAQKGILRISNIEYNHGICTTPRRTTQTSFIANRFYTNHHDAEACEDRGQSYWQRSSMNTILKTKDNNVVTNANHRIDSSRTTRTHSTNS